MMMSRTTNLVNTGIARSALICWTLAAVFQGGAVLAQVVKLTETTAFSNPLFLQFSDLQPGSDASQVYSNFGVTFVGEAGSTPTIRADYSRPFLESGPIPFLDWVLRNESPTASSANRALVVRFERPLKRIGLTLGNGAASTVAEIQAFTAKGEFLGKIQQTGIEPLRGPFVGLETSHPSGISFVVLDYGAELSAEQISDIRAEFLSPVKFKVYLSQIVHGRTGNLSFQTVIQIQSVLTGVTADAESAVRLRLFDQTGAPLRMTLDEKEGSEFEFNLGTSPRLPTFGSRQLQTAGVSDVTVGYASIESNLPIIAHAIVRVFRSDGSLQSETGMPSGAGRITHVATIERDPQRALDTAFAIVNVGDGEARLEFRLTYDAGEAPYDSGTQRRFVLRLGEQRAFFFSELFEFFRDRQIRGQMTIWSNKPVVVTSLRTLGGLPTSSQAIGSTQR